MSPETTHKRMGFYTEVSIFCFFKLFPVNSIECIGLKPHEKIRGQSRGWEYIPL